MMESLGDRDLCLALELGILIAVTHVGSVEVQYFPFDLYSLRGLISIEQSLVCLTSHHSLSPLS